MKMKISASCIFIVLLVILILLAVQLFLVVPVNFIEVNQNDTLKNRSNLFAPGSDTIYYNNELFKSPRKGNEFKVKRKRREPDLFYDSECGYESCNKIKEGMLNVHFIPHSHLDLGWLKTLNEYYYKHESDESGKEWFKRGKEPSVKRIIDSVIQEVEKESSRRFTFTETAYLWKWWKNNTEEQRNRLKYLVRTGKIEIAGGGWSMNDEAVTHYQPIIDQFTFGLRKLSGMFGECGQPRAAWQIDSYGHSREIASILARVGYDGLFLSRIHYKDKQERLENKEMEMIWEGSPDNLGSNANIFTSILYDGYFSPPFFCADRLCNNFANENDSVLPLEMIRDFIHYVRTAAKTYSTRNLLMPMGGDFAYDNSFRWYFNMDRLMWQVNKKQNFGLKLNVLYSTPSCYLKAINEESFTYNSKSDDFFPYATNSDAFWAGFYTSRPSLKLYERKANNFLQICNQLHVLSNLGSRDLEITESLKSAMGVLQHHNAITGTAKHYVAEDFVNKLTIGISKCEKVINKALRRLIHKPNKDNMKQKIRMVNCPLLNISHCEITEESNTFIVTVYNPHSSVVTEYVRFPLPGRKPVDYDIIDHTGGKVSAQIIPIPTYLREIPGRGNGSRYELLFEAANIPPLGFISYYVTNENVEDKTPVTLAMKLRKTVTIGFKNKTQLTMDKNGTITKITLNGRDIEISQDFYHYTSQGSRYTPYYINTTNEQFSGAYVFRPEVQSPYNVLKLDSLNNQMDIKVFRGPIVHEIHVKHSTWVSQTVRIYNNANYIEFDWLVGPIPLQGDEGREVVSRFTLPTSNQNTYVFIDSNGREMIERDFSDSSKSVAEKYYPVTSRITVFDADSQTQYSILTDRPQGGTWVENEQSIELMVHRRVLSNDKQGLDDSLNEVEFDEPLVVRGSHYLTFGNFQNQTAVERVLAQRMYLRNWLFFTPLKDTSFAEWRDIFKMEYSGLKKSLPDNVHLLTVESLQIGRILIRLEHIFEINDDPVLSQPVTIDLKDLFAPFNVHLVEEMTLGANINKEDLQRLQWNYKSSSDDANPNDQQFHRHVRDTSSNNYVIELSPMEIRTFIVTIDSNFYFDSIFG